MLLDFGGKQMMSSSDRTAIPEIDDSKSEVALEHDHSEAQHIPVLSTTPLSQEKQGSMCRLPDEEISVCTAVTLEESLSSSFTRTSFENVQPVAQIEGSELPVFDKIPHAEVALKNKLDENRDDAGRIYQQARIKNTNPHLSKKCLEAIKRGKPLSISLDLSHKEGVIQNLSVPLTKGKYTKYEKFNIFQEAENNYSHEMMSESDKMPRVLKEIVQAVDKKDIVTGIVNSEGVLEDVGILSGLGGRDFEMIQENFKVLSQKEAEPTKNEKIFFDKLKETPKEGVKRLNTANKLIAYTFTNTVTRIRQKYTALKAPSIHVYDPRIFLDALYDCGIVPRELPESSEDLLSYELHFPSGCRMVVAIPMNKPDKKTEGDGTK